MKRQEITNNVAIALNAPLPRQTKTYTVIPHWTVLKVINGCMEKNKLTANNIIYTSTHTGNVLTGKYILDTENSSDLKVSFGFTNSYDKTTRFCITSCAYIPETDMYMMFDKYTYKRKHTGTGDQDSYTNIGHIIEIAKDTLSNYEELRQKMTSINLSKVKFGQLLGELVVRNMLTISQMSLALKYSKYTNFGYDKYNLWELFNHILKAASFGQIKQIQEKNIALQMYLYAKYCNVIPMKEEDKPTSYETAKNLFD